MWIVSTFVTTILRCMLSTMLQVWLPAHATCRATHFHVASCRKTLRQVEVTCNLYDIFPQFATRNLLHKRCKSSFSNTQNIRPKSRRTQMTWVFMFVWLYNLFWILEGQSRFVCLSFGSINSNCGLRHWPIVAKIHCAFRNVTQRIFMSLGRRKQL